MYLKSVGNHTKITLRNTSIHYYVVIIPNKLERKLPDVFFKCHRSAIVNLAYIQKIDKKEICVINQFRLPVSRSKIHLIEEKLADFEALTVPLCDQCAHCSRQADSGSNDFHGYAICRGVPLFKKRAARGTNPLDPFSWLACIDSDVYGEFYALNRRLWNLL